MVATLVSKIGFNLQHRVDMPECIKKSMDLLFEFVAGVHIVHWISRAPELIVTGRLLLETPTGAYFLTNHCSAEFKFLSMRRCVVLLLSVASVFFSPLELELVFRVPSMLLVWLLHSLVGNCSFHGSRPTYSEVVPWLYAAACWMLVVKFACVEISVQY